MTQGLASLREALDSISRALSRVKAERVNSKDLRAKVALVVSSYFRTMRPSSFRYEEVLMPVDQGMQNLLKLSQSRSPLAQYRSQLRDLRRSLNDLELVSVVVRFDDVSEVVQDATPAAREIDARDRRLIDTLQGVCPSAAASYEQAIRDLADTSRISWRGTASELREALREVLDRLAPDKEVMSRPGFELEKDVNRPTKKQQVVFILSSRGRPSAAVDATKKALDVVEVVIGGFVKSVYDRSSNSAHTTTDRAEVVRVKAYVSTVLSEVLEIGD